MLKLFLGLAAGRAAQRATEALRRAALLAVAAVLGLIAAGFGVAAAFIAAKPYLGPVGTSLAFGAFFLVLALIVALMARRRPPVAAQAPLSALATLPILQAQAQAQARNVAGAVPRAIARAPGTALMAAFAGGLILALRLRR